MPFFFFFFFSDSKIKWKGPKLFTTWEHDSLIRMPLLPLETKMSPFSSSMAISTLGSFCWTTHCSVRSTSFVWSRISIKRELISYLYNIRNIKRVMWIDYSRESEWRWIAYPSLSQNHLQQAALFPVVSFIPQFLSQFVQFMGLALKSLETHTPGSIRLLIH